MKDVKKFGVGLMLALALFLMLGAGSVQAVQTTEIDCSAQTAVPEDQCEALVAIYQGAGGENWDNQTGWLTDENVCQWYGVSCNAGTVVALDLYGNNLAGPLPLEIGGFPDLKTLTLNDNALTGSIPLTVTFLDLDLFHFHNTSLCEPDDPAFQDWLSQIVYRLSSGLSCSTSVPTNTASPYQTYTPQATSNLPWPEQTLTALAVEATRGAAGSANASPTPTKYYTLDTATPQPEETEPVSAATAVPSLTPEAGGFLSGIPRGWLLLLLVPVILIVVGVMLELRDRKKEADQPKPDNMEFFDIEE